MMAIITQILIYTSICFLYRNRQLNNLFILKSLQTLKISKYRTKISEKIQKRERRFKWFLFWPLIDLYETYEDYKENRSRNT
jgi:hypothetical protein